ncbi:MAG: dUTP diphosphatase [Candidatus Moraniibacteriota bacterium]
MKIQIKKISKDAIIPKNALKGDAGLDLYSVENKVLKPGQKMSIRTGIAIKIPEGFAGLVWDKSGISHNNGIKTLGGVIDSNYTGEWFVGLINLGKEDFKIEKGQKIAQALFQKVELPEIEQVDEINKTNRGDGGFGSTGLR